MKIVLTVFVLIACVATMGVIFWKQEMKYALPTPVPVQYVSVSAGDQIILPSKLKSGNAYFLHFYNPECPCSRFNARHIQSLIRNYGDSIQFAIVVSGKNDLKKAQAEFPAGLSYIIDTDHSLAESCGVYSTPQAAIVKNDGTLFYRGNYNKSRYCTSRASNFAELSLIAMMNNQPAPSFGLSATQSYGCELQTDNPEFEFF